MASLLTAEHAVRTSNQDDEYVTDKFSRTLELVRLADPSRMHPEMILRLSGFDAFVPGQFLAAAAQVC